MWPFKPSELFVVNPDFRAELLRTDPAVVVVDDFYLAPEKVREFVLSMPYPIWKHHQQTKNFFDYYDCRHNILLDYPEPQLRVAEIAHRLMRIHVNMSTPQFRTNMFRLIRDQRPDTQAHPHCDGLSLASLVYLNFDEESSGGTAFYRHREFQLDQLPRDEKARKEVSDQIFQGEEIEDGRDYFHEWQNNWEQTLMVEMKFNRMVIWPGIAFHGAWHEPNSFKDFWRINQVIFHDKIEYLDD